MQHSETNLPKAVAVADLKAVEIKFTIASANPQLLKGPPWQWSTALFRSGYA